MCERRSVDGVYMFIYMYVWESLRRHTLYISRIDLFMCICERLSIGVIYICVHMYVWESPCRLYICVYICMRERVCAGAHSPGIVCMYMCLCLCERHSIGSMCMYIYMYSWKTLCSSHMYVYTCIVVRMYVCMYVCIYVYVHVRDSLNVPCVCIYVQPITFGVWFLQRNHIEIWEITLLKSQSMI